MKRKYRKFRSVGTAVSALLVALAAPAAVGAQTTGGATEGPGAGGARAAALASLRARAQAARARGDSAAAVTVYEIADFQCPFCARFAREVGPRIDSAYVQTGKVKWVFVTFPLPGHSLGWAAAEAAMCAGGAGGKFWAYHDELYQHQDAWTTAADPSAVFLGYARQAGVPTDAWQKCVDSDAVAPLILEDVIAAAASQVSGTPTFVVNNQDMVVGLKTFDEWKSILDKALAKAPASHPPSDSR